MYYRIKNNQVCDFADYNYAQDCLYTDLCSMDEYNNSKELYVIKDNQLFLSSDSEDILRNKNKAKFENEFFETSLGWIRRKVRMKDGSTRDFLADLLLQIKAGMELGNEVKVITYSTPDFSFEMNSDYIKTLQKKEKATSEFIRECLLQTINDFGIGG